MVTPTYYPVAGGTETVVRNLSAWLNQNGVTADVLTFNMNRRWNPKWQGNTEKISGINVFRIPALNWLPISHSNRITLGINLIPGRFASILKRYDVLHFHEFELSFPLFSFFLRKPKIIHFHGIDLDFLKRYHLSRTLLKNLAEVYISISRRMENDLVSLGIPMEKIRYLPNGVNSDLFVPRGKKLRNSVLFVGRITMNKGLHVLLRSLNYINESVHLIVIGPRDWDLQYYKDMIRRIEEINKGGKHEIRFLGALNDQDEIIRWYQKASIFVLPSFREGFPVTPLEALSCETPVIATPVGGIPEVVQNHKNGVLIPPSNPTKLAEAIEYLLNDEGARSKFGQDGRKFVARNFSLKSVAEKLLTIYEEMTDNQ